MILVRRSQERGRTLRPWLDSRHTFSSGEYRDPAHEGFRALRVLDEDVIGPGSGFGMHGRRDLEIVTWVLSGALERRDDLGSGSVLRPGDVQRLSAGLGIRHSEWNPSWEHPVHLLRIGILPERRGLDPECDQTRVGHEALRGRLAVLAGAEGAVGIHQDARILGTVLDGGSSIELEIAPGRHAWIQVVRGRLAADEAELDGGDGAAVAARTRVRLEAREPCEALVVDLA